jgi:hypothetical protein
MSKNERFSWGNLIFLFVVAFLAGIIIKKATNSHIRIGFDDPATIIEHGELYDIDKLEQKLLREGVPAVPDDVNVNNEIIE